MITIVLLILAYLLGSIPSGLWIGQVFFQINLREHGSGNTGTTNTFRILGQKAGMATFVIDFFKGTLATLLPIMFHLQGVFASHLWTFSCHWTYLPYLCRI